MEPHQIRVELSRSDAQKALAEVAEAWGAAWSPEGTGGRLVLPLVAGLRRGVWRGRVELSGSAGATWITLRPEEVTYRLNLPAVLVLTLGAAGAVAATLWPFFPALLAVAPFAVVLALAAWFLIVTRLRSGGVEEFLQLVAGPAGGEAPLAPAGESRDRTPSG